ncbi:MAG: bifunctional 3-deoxy-7-phosphoheptulonate synthase/chorismate mutase type II [Muribaculaceae bacterium]|nr:bifunctional 3-deoxy-7-phosphoheptulonate synthase/chorismate mutase type II [Muribaculaceae bacterium]
MSLEGLQPLVEGAGVAGSPLVMAGPCSAETEEQTLSTARQLAMGGVKVFRAGIWKPRTKPGGFEGIGKEGLQWLKRVKEETGMLVATEVAMRRHVEEALEAGVDILWIGARTSANPFAVQEIADALKDSGADVAVLVKNPVNPDLELWIGALERLYNAGVRRLGAIHRGFSFYGKSIYRNPPQWHIPIELHRRLPELPIVVDPSHMGGRRELIAPLCQQALDMKFTGLMIESHCTPDEAWSDKNQQVTPESLRIILSSLVLRNAEQDTESLQQLRQQIDRVDTELLDLYNRRMEISREIGKYKKEHSMPVVQESRYDDLIKSRVAAAVQMGMSADFMKTVLQAIHEESVRQQIEILNKN